MSPVTGMKPPTRASPRSRILTDHELRWLGRACAAGGRPIGPLVRLLILTAQRRDEVACLERAELDLDKRMWTMPREKAKEQSHAPCPFVGLSHRSAELHSRRRG